MPRKVSFERAEVIAVKDRYEAVWQPVLRELKKAGRLADDGKVARLLLFGALKTVADVAMHAVEHMQIKKIRDG